ncbi:DUF3231 family protein [Oceanobacillus manasiensis]|uniref:DUF3231 family protein n=1 Tax=Oceanobacillus manasiensis TaxID=586413 RepID=UPI0005A75E60|nr:DUF3231 family protein [Oceanobacillus manasiensis]
MPNVFEAMLNTLKMSIDNTDKKEKKAPLHTGEVTNCWVYYTMLHEFLRYEEVGLNTTTDDEVNEMLKDAMKMCKPQLKRLEEFMVEEGIPLPGLPGKKPISNGNDIPLGAKLTDDELANGISLKVAGAIIQCATGQAQVVRNDIGYIWIKFQLEMITFGTTLKALMRKRGWLRVPPHYYPPGMPEK